MEKERFEKIKSTIGASIKMKLDTIWKNLHDDKAACLIGAGFSKNAEMDEVTTMKDWPELGTEFYKSLYGDSFSFDDLKFRSVLRLASQVEAAKGRAELESIIQNSLPNERVFPGRLHIDLMKLPWNDVFTTNYDTLLEKAYIEADRYYFTVTNKETLLYTPHPRIIKLHGSFPDIRPFIITEEDFRTYPQKFPEFVNTVRQSLIENVLCLIGFSGDDPNFLSWLGWLRDVMGKQSTPVYQITYDKQIHDANVMLSYELGIITVNLAEISGLTGYSDALDFFMSYLAQEYCSVWKGRLRIDFSTRKDCSKVIELTNEMEQIRTSYPGWYLLPSKYISHFDDVKTEFPFYANMYKNSGLNKIQQIEFLYEIDWRLHISFSSCDVEWFCDAIRGIIDFQTDDSQLRRKVMRLHLSLLEYFRTKQDSAAFLELTQRLNEKRSEMIYEHLNIFFYQQCLFYVSNLDYEQANNLLNSWNLRSMDYKGALWKSCILMEVGRTQEAETLLKEMLNTVKKNILSTSYSEQLISARSALDYRIWYMDVVRNPISVTNDNFDIERIFESCRNMISKSESLPEEFLITHDFNLLSTGRQWNSGEGGFQGDYLGAYRYFKIYEAIGLPIGCPHGISMGMKTKQAVLNVLAKYNLGYALSLLVRCCDNRALKHVLNRNNLLLLSREAANSFYDSCIETCKKGVQVNTPFELRYRILNVLLPALTRMSVKLDSIKNKELFILWMAVYRDYDRYYDSSMITTLYMNTTDESLTECNQMALEAPIKEYDHVKDMVMPWNGLENAIVSPKAYENFINALNSENEIVSSRAYCRLKTIYNCALSDIQREMINTSVGLWRLQKPLTTQKLYSLLIVKPEKDAELITFCGKTFESTRSSVFISEFEQGLHRLYVLYPHMTIDDHICVVNKIVDFLNVNEELFKKDDSREFFGGFHTFVEEVINQIRWYTQTDSLPSPENPIWQSLLQVLLKYRKYNYPLMTSIAHLSFMGRFDKTKLKNLVAESILSDKDEIVADSVNALVYMAKKQGKRLNQAIIKQIINYITHSLNGKTASYIEMLPYILKYGGIGKEAMVQLMAYMDSFVFHKNYRVQEELRAEVMYHSNVLAGAMSVLVPNWNGLEIWRLKMSEDSVFNDVRAGFNQGEKIARA